MTPAELGLRTTRTATLGEIHVVKAQRDHECDLCGWTIPAGDHYWSWTLAPSWHDFGDWFTGRVHAICDAVYKCSEWFEPYEALPFYTDFRSELLDQVEWATSNVVAYR